jgi:hypothetical protein
VVGQQGQTLTHQFRLFSVDTALEALGLDTSRVDGEVIDALPRQTRPLNQLIRLE